MTNLAKQLKASTCPYCGVGCGIEVSVATNETSQTLTELQGNRQHPANFGRLCIKGQSLTQTTQPEGRLLAPRIFGKQQSWDEATTWVANKLIDTIEKHGKDSVAFYVSGQLLTEDYYVANKLMKGFIGSANIDTNSRLCMSSAVAAYTRAFGEDLVPCCYEDLDKTDVLVLIGSNAAWTHPVLFQRMERAKQLNPSLMVIQVDPRKTATSSLVDVHLPIKPGTDAVLFNGLLRYISKHALDTDYIESCTDGFDKALLEAQEFTPQRVAKSCDVPLADVTFFFQTFALSPSAVSFYSMGINQSTSGVDKANAIINCHLASGKIGKQGSGPFSITGQPNAMGGREVGGLSNMLAAHLSFDNPEHHDLVSEFWRTENLATTPGLKAVDLFDGINQGKVKFIWIMGTNPVASMPNREKIEAALAKCNAVVVSDVVQSNDTLHYAHVALPATPWSEKDGTVTNSERCISRQRSLVEPLGEAKHDWQIICDVAHKMGFAEAFSFESPSQIFNEHAKLTAYKNNGERALNLMGLVDLSEQEYQDLSPIQWPVNGNQPYKWQGQKRLFEDKKFFTPNKRAQFIAITPRLPKQLSTSDFPYVLNTGRMRDQWHTMTRTGNAAKLHQHTPVAYLYVHPADAQMLSMQENDLVQLTSSTNKRGDVILPLQFDSNLRRSTLFAPIHWTNEWASNASVSWLFSSDTDPISGQPELKHASVKLSKLNMQQQALLASREALAATTLSAISDYWTCTKQVNCYVYRMGIKKTTASQVNWLDSIKSSGSGKGVFYEYKNTNLTSQTCVSLDLDKLEMVVHFMQGNPSIANDWLDSLFSAALDMDQLPHILRFTPPVEFIQGNVICSCYQVRELAIKQAIQNGTTTLDGLGAQLKCGTNCGSCKSEVLALIELTHSNCNPSVLGTNENEITTKPRQVIETLIPIKNLEASNL
jgi:assimilatory nitrate reductase catalytic subunit